MHNTNKTKIRDLPKSRRIFMYSYFGLLILTLGGFISAAINNQTLTLIFMVLLMLDLVLNIVFAFKK